MTLSVAPQLTEPPGLSTTGPEGCPQGWMPGKLTFSDAEAKAAINPLQYVPIVGTIYRAITGETLPTPLKIAGSVASAAILGGPIGVFGTVFLGLAEELVRLGPDLSRPALPQGFSMNGSEGGVSPVTPGTDTTPGGYTTLATTIPDFLTRPNSNQADTGSQTATQTLAAYEWQRNAMVEHGVL